MSDESVSKGNDTLESIDLKSADRPRSKPNSQTVLSQEEIKEAPEELENRQSDIRPQPKFQMRDALGALTRKSVRDEPVEDVQNDEGPEEQSDQEDKKEDEEEQQPDPVIPSYTTSKQEEQPQQEPRHASQLSSGSQYGMGTHSAKLPDREPQNSYRTQPTSSRGQPSSTTNSKQPTSDSSYAKKPTIDTHHAENLSSRARSPLSSTKASDMQHGKAQKVNIFKKPINELRSADKQRTTSVDQTQPTSQLQQSSQRFASPANYTQTQPTVKDSKFKQNPSASNAGPAQNQQSRSPFTQSRLKEQQSQNDQPLSVEIETRGNRQSFRTFQREEPELGKDEPGVSVDDDIPDVSAGIKIQETGESPDSTPSAMEIKVLTQKIQTMETRYESLSQENSVLQSQIQRSEDEIIRYRKQLDQARRQVSDLSANSQGHSSANEEVDRLRVRVEEQNKELDSLMQKNTQLDDEIDELKKTSYQTNKENIKRIKDLQSDLARQKKDTSDTDHTIGSLADERNALADKNAKLELDLKNVHLDKILLP